MKFKGHKALWIGLSCTLIGGILAIFVLPYYLATKDWTGVNYTLTGQIGDTINGIAGPFIALGAAIITFMAFYIQYQANIQQNEQINEQNKQIKEQTRQWEVERFENRFYELVKIHKENVNEMQIVQEDGKIISGREIFVVMFEELRYGYFLLKNDYVALKTSEQITNEYDDDKLLNLAYTYFFWGTSLITLNESFYETVAKFDTLNNSYFSKLNAVQSKKFKADVKDEIGKVLFTRNYVPFRGHSSRLGHYYRHLYQTVKFIVSQSDDLLKEKEKDSYLTILRAQLSNHEQILLYYNAISGFGSRWIIERYLTYYGMIHNIPLGQVDMGTPIIVRFKDDIRMQGKKLFEWQE
jgi:hypothetical protein